MQVLMQRLHLLTKLRPHNSTWLSQLVALAPCISLQLLNQKCLSDLTARQQHLHRRAPRALTSIALPIIPTTLGPMLLGRGSGPGSKRAQEVTNSSVGGQNLR